MEWTEYVSIVQNYYLWGCYQWSKAQILPLDSTHDFSLRSVALFHSLLIYKMNAKRNHHLPNTKVYGVVQVVTALTNQSITLGVLCLCLANLICPKISLIAKTAIPCLNEYFISRGQVAAHPVASTYNSLHWFSAFPFTHLQQQETRRTTVKNVFVFYHSDSLMIVFKTQILFFFPTRP